jgi:hypothetical protein
MPSMLVSLYFPAQRLLIQSGAVRGIRGRRISGGGGAPRWMLEFGCC